MELHNFESRLLNKGMVQDINIKFQEEGTYRFALNAVLESEDGQLGTMLNEQSNKLCGQVPEGFTVIGHCLINDSRVVLFAASATESYIGYWDPATCTTTQIVRTGCLGFSTSSPIETMFRTIADCSSIIYFTDGVNPYRSINLDKLSSYQDEQGDWVCSKFDFTPDLTVPLIDSNNVFDNGGSLKVGAYQFAIRYVDALNNPTNWFYVTRPVTIYDESISEDYYNIDGGFNIIDSPDESGAVPLTSKAIQLQISNLDQQFYFYQIAVLLSASGTGQVSETYIMPKTEITATTSTYTLSSVSPTTGAIPTVPDEITVDVINIHIAKTHAQIDSRHILGNLEFKDYKYADFQRVANNIKVKFKTQRVRADEANELGNAKHPLSTFKKQSFMGDEVLAIAVEFLNKKGEWSSPFHIPGRESMAHDLTLVPPFPGSEFLSSTESQPYWKLFSSALPDGTLGYHEGNTDYPNLECDGERVFPSGKIRHHRMPDRETVPHYIQDESYQSDAYAPFNQVPGYIQLIGLEFSDVEYPHDDIVGHRFLVSTRSRETSTVIDNGYFSLSFKESVLGNATSVYSYAGFGVSANSYLRSKVASYINPKFLFQSIFEQGTHFRVLGYYGFFTNTFTTFSRENARVLCESGLFASRRVDISAYASAFQNQLSLQMGNTGVDVPKLWTYESSSILAPNSYRTNFGSQNIRVINELESNFLNIFYFDRPFIPSPVSITGMKNGFVYASHKNYISPYEDLFAIQYEVAHNGYLTVESSQEVYGGDAFIANMNYFEIVGQKLTGSNKRIDSHTAGWLFIESSINFALGNSGADSCEQMLKFNPLFTNGTPLIDYTLDRVLTLNSDGDCFLERESTCRQYYGYNRDFSKRPIEKTISQINTNNDAYCGNCANKYPYRIVASEKAFQTQQSDNRQTFKANNFTDVLGKDGPITRLFVDKDQLYALTERSLYFIPVRPQSLQTNESVIYVGTGEIFSIPPKKISTMDYSYGGTTHKWSLCSSQFGTAWVDEASSKVFLLSDQLRELSAIGMSSFFERHLDVTLLKTLDSLGIQYAHRSTHASNGVGFICFFDPRYKRLIVSKKDFKPLLPVELRGDNPQRGILYVDNDSIFYIWDGTYIQVEFSNANLFENRSFTISFGLSTNSWVSFHSYIPQHAFNDETTFYTTLSEGVWRHNETGFQSFYDSPFDFVVETVFTTPNAIQKVWDNIDLVINVERWDPDYMVHYKVTDKTFDRAVFYSDSQSSGLQSLIIKSDAFMNVSRLNPDQAAIQRVDNKWQLSEIRNWANDTTPVFTSNWAQTQTAYYIDKVVNPNAIDYTKSMFQTSRIKGDHLVTRLYFNAETHYRLSIDLINISKRISIR